MKTLPAKSAYETNEDYHERLYPILHGRHRDGTFAVGNTGGPGRPRKKYKFTRNCDGAKINGGKRKMCNEFAPEQK